MSPLDSQIAPLQRALLDWYAQAQRPLPWRTQPSLYKTVVSELMAQQTQIKTMLPYFERWLQRFPDFETLAEAPSEDVLKHWEGLGYYSRARNLHQLAKDYVALNDKPQTRDAWQALPGIGPYTAAAISSIAQGYPAAVVDGNVVRILARLSKDSRSFKNNGAAVKAMTPLADALLNHDSPGNHNQAMMELGATICTKQQPQCTRCPVADYCAGGSAGSAEALPKITRAVTQRVKIDRLWILDDGKLLLHRIPMMPSNSPASMSYPPANCSASTLPRARRWRSRRVASPIGASEKASMPQRHPIDYPPACTGSRCKTSTPLRSPDPTAAGFRNCSRPEARLRATPI
jgi:A/G-specific adenine glycosylase